MYKTYQQDFILRTCDCDFMGQWRPSAIMQTMQELAGMHSELLGCGRNALIDKNVVWVLTRCEIHMDRYPKIGDRITAETFPTANRRWFFPRYYFFRDERGDSLGYAATLWVLMDINERRMLPPGDVARLLPENADLPLPMGLPAVVDNVLGEETVTRRVPAYFDLDVNGHVNNTRCLDWCCGALGHGVMAEHRVAAFDVNYDAEILPGARIETGLVRDGLRFSFCGQAGGRRCFGIAGTLSSRE